MHFCEVKSSRALSSDEAVRPLQQFEQILQQLLPGLPGSNALARALPSGRLVVQGMRQPQLQQQEGVRQHPLPHSDTEAGRLALPGMRQLQLVLQVTLQFEWLPSTEGVRRSGGGEASVASRSPPVLSRLHGVPLFRHQHTIAAKHHALPTISSVQVSIHRDSVARRQHCACHQTCPALAVRARGASKPFLSCIVKLMHTMPRHSVVEFGFASRVRLANRCLE